ncbi:Mom family adenine methylcarbamoylation protein [Cytobacillus purgationiresistens]|uniref:N-acetyltransferase domain-containing protein n=1 Tax=Cytobacillus purgationiresistens TaxID=863449 RepID=A0ABU0AI69_9BACI|nr:hypothetical protein [Cytobacillus purgationiresistens]MDQ0270750.1 hypothetical protein [Cytobacillus purgationiresistens]
MRIEVSRSTELDRWVADRDYLKSTPAGARLRLWVLDDTGERIGAMMWGRPNARQLDQHALLELTRMYLVEEAPKNSESKSLGLARKYIRKNMPEIKGIIAYSSTGMRHEGTIYKADNWFELGRSKVSTKGWSNRVGRENRDASEKIRWVRTP